MDSPKCPLCIETGDIAQTYKIAGKARYKCQRCGKVTEKQGLDDREFKWRTNHLEWSTMLSERIKDKQDGLKDRIRKQVEEIEAIVMKGNK